jgi:hypothetical protein
MKSHCTGMRRRRIGRGGQQVVYVDQFRAPPGKMIGVPVRVEPKVVFAAERTFPYVSHGGPLNEEGRYVTYKGEWCGLVAGSMMCAAFSLSPRPTRQRSFLHPHRQHIPRADTIHHNHHLGDGTHLWTAPPLAGFLDNSPIVITNTPSHSLSSLSSWACVSASPPGLHPLHVACHSAHQPAPLGALPLVLRGAEAVERDVTILPRIAAVG